jgi:hypothetical protein
MASAGDKSVFISYARKDGAQLAGRLLMFGSSRRILPRFVEYRRTAIQSLSNGIVPNSAHRGWRRDENYVRAQSKGYRTRTAVAPARILDAIRTPNSRMFILRRSTTMSSGNGWQWLQSIGRRYPCPSPLEQAFARLVEMPGTAKSGRRSRLGKSQECERWQRVK